MTERERDIKSFYTCLLILVVGFIIVPLLIIDIGMLVSP
jgi:uncharacterized membrane protein